MPLSLEDRFAIGELVSKYNIAIDHFDAETWAGTFTEDGVLIVDGGVRAKGRADLTEYVAKRPKSGPKFWHWVVNTLVDGDGNKATLTAYVMVFRLEGPPRTAHLMGEYNDDLVKENGAWRFKARRMNAVARAAPAGDHGASEVPQSSS